MRIIRLQAEGFKRIVAVDITPEGDLVEVRGDNGNGKSSVLDAIFAALGGADAAPEMPVREGEEAAVIRLDLGELIVTRYFTAAGTTGLKVMNREGMVATSGQTMLDKLVGHISFDPLEFLELKPEEQAEELRKLVSIADPESGEVLDLEAIAKANATDFAKRTEVNRDGKNLLPRIEALGGLRTVPDEVPDREALLSGMQSAAETNAGIERERLFRESKDRELNELDAELDQLAGQIEDMQRRLTEGRDLLAEGRELLAKAPPLAAPVDVAELRAKLEEADRIAENVRVNEQRAALMGQFDELKAESVRLTKAMADRDLMRAKAIAAAEMPVDGLELVIDDGKLGVRFNGVPFSQASDAEQLRVSVAVAMAANPELRVIRLKNASLLDKRAVATLRDLAAGQDFQIWAEFVGDEGPGIIMEAGEVRGAEKPEPLPKPRQRKKAGAEEDGETSENGGNLPPPGGAERAPASVSHETRQPGTAAKSGSPSTLFERMAETAEEPRRRPQAMTEFTTKPRGEQ